MAEKKQDEEKKSQTEQFEEQKAEQGHPGKVPGEGSQSTDAEQGVGGEDADSDATGSGPSGGAEGDSSPGTPSTGVEGAGGSGGAESA